MNLYNDSNLIVFGESHFNSIEVESIRAEIHKINPDIVLHELYYDEDFGDIDLRPLEPNNDESMRAKGLVNQFILREKDMVDTIESTISDNPDKVIVVVVGDTHLRTVITKELGDVSPITESIESNGGMIIRSATMDIESIDTIKSQTSTVNMFSELDQFFKSYIDVDKDPGIYERLRAFRLKWVVKRIDANYTNADFLGGMTTGVQKVRFSSLDESMLANEVFRVDVKTMQSRLFMVKGMYREHRVHTKIYNQILVYLISYGLRNNVDEKYLMDAYLVMAYMMVTSMIVRRFDYPLDPRIAASVVEKMSDQFILKQLGSWEKYLEYRGSFVMPGSKNAVLLKEQYNADTTLLVIPSLQSNIKSTMNIIMGIVMDTHDGDIRVNTSSLLVLENEEVVLSDVKNSMSVYTRRALESITSRGFSNDDYVYLISELSPNINTSAFKTMLMNISEHTIDNFDLVNRLVEDIVSSMISYLTRTDNLSLVSTSLFDVLRLLKSYYASSNVKDELVISLKKDSMDLVLKSTTMKTSWVLTALNINLIIYIILVALTKK